MSRGGQCLNFLLRNKLRGRARQTINNYKFTTIKQLTDRLLMSFGTIRDICDCYAELKKLSAGRRESIDDYIGRAQILYDNIIQAEKNEKQSLTNSDISRINFRFIDEFYYGIPSDIRTLVEKRDDLTFVEFYQIVEKANHRLEKITIRNKRMPSHIRHPVTNLAQKRVLFYRTHRTMREKPYVIHFEEASEEITETIAIGMIRTKRPM
ncbi:hypothetical protein HN011_005607 [Eciton burchellii]|nr:hypothetical protein HN011_005607 [Eciton burchellii]